MWDSTLVLAVLASFSAFKDIEGDSDSPSSEKDSKAAD